MNGSRQEQTHQLKTRNACLRFDSTSGRLVSFRVNAAPDQDFIATGAQHPVFVIQYLDGERAFRELDSLSAEETNIVCEGGGAENRLRMRFHRLNGLDIDAEVTVCVHEKNDFSHWRIAIDNQTDMQIVNVQFPFVVCAYEPGGKANHEALLIPKGGGNLIKSPKPETIGPDTPTAWQMVPPNGTTDFYPGSVYAQFMTFYNESAGLYLACNDTEGHVKLFKALHRDPGMRLGIAHVGDWPRQGKRELEYEVLVGGFTGDWYQAADMYREWSLQQKWAVPLHQRTDVPEWLLDSPPILLSGSRACWMQVQSIRLKNSFHTANRFPCWKRLQIESGRRWSQC